MDKTDLSRDDDNVPSYRRAGSHWHQYGRSNDRQKGHQRGNPEFSRLPNVHFRVELDDRCPRLTLQARKSLVHRLRGMITRTASSVASSSSLSTFLERSSVATVIMYGRGRDSRFTGLRAHSCGHCLGLPVAQQRILQFALTLRGPSGGHCVELEGGVKKMSEAHHMRGPFRPPAC